MSNNHSIASAVFEIARLEQPEQQRPFITTVWPQGRMELYWISQGKAMICEGTTRLALKKHSVLCIRTDKRYILQCDKDVKGYVIRFASSLLQTENLGDERYKAALFQLLENISVLELKEVYVEELRSVCELLIHEKNEGGKFCQQVISQYLHILLAYLIRKTQVSQLLPLDHLHHQVVYQFKIVLEQQFKSERRVHEYAKALAVAPNHLNRLVKSHTGHSAGYHIRQRILTEAVRRVRFHGATMKEVSWSLGFSSIAHFSKFFKKEMGMTFSAFRKAELAQILTA